MSSAGSGSAAPISDANFLPRPNACFDSFRRLILQTIYHWRVRAPHAPLAPRLRDTFLETGAKVTFQLQPSELREAIEDCEHGICTSVPEWPAPANAGNTAYPELIEAANNIRRRLRQQNLDAAHEVFKSHPYWASHLGAQAEEKGQALDELTPMQRVAHHSLKLKAFSSSYFAQVATQLARPFRPESLARFDQAGRSESEYFSTRFFANDPFYAVILGSYDTAIDMWKLMQRIYPHDFDYPGQLYQGGVRADSSPSLDDDTEIDYLKAVIDEVITRLKAYEGSSRLNLFTRGPHSRRVEMCKVLTGDKKSVGWLGMLKNMLDGAHKPSRCFVYYFLRRCLQNLLAHNVFLTNAKIVGREAVGGLVKVKANADCKLGRLHDIAEQILCDLPLASHAERALLARQIIAEPHDVDKSTGDGISINGYRKTFTEILQNDHARQAIPKNKRQAIEAPSYLVVLDMIRVELESARNSDTVKSYLKGLRDKIIDCCVLKQDRETVQEYPLHRKLAYVKLVNVVQVSRLRPGLRVSFQFPSRSGTAPGVIQSAPGVVGGDGGSQPHPDPAPLADSVLPPRVPPPKRRGSFGSLMSMGRRVSRGSFATGVTSEGSRLPDEDWYWYQQNGARRQSCTTDDLRTDWSTIRTSPSPVSWAGSSRPPSRSASPLHAFAFSRRQLIAASPDATARASSASRQRPASRHLPPVRARSVSRLRVPARLLDSVAEVSTPKSELPGSPTHSVTTTASTSPKPEPVDAMPVRELVATETVQQSPDSATSVGRVPTRPIVAN